MGDRCRCLRKRCGIHGWSLDRRGRIDTTHLPLRGIRLNDEGTTGCLRHRRLKSARACRRRCRLGQGVEYLVLRKLDLQISTGGGEGVSETDVDDAVDQRPEFHNDFSGGRLLLQGRRRKTRHDPCRNRSRIETELFGASPSKQGRQSQFRRPVAGSGCRRCRGLCLLRWRSGGLLKLRIRKPSQSGAGRSVLRRSGGSFGRLGRKQLCNGRLGIGGRCWSSGTKWRWLRRGSCGAKWRRHCLR